MKKTITDPGFYQDKHGVTMLARVVLDGWQLGQMQALTEKIEAEWDKYGNLPSRLPPELSARHTALYKMAVERARKKGWDPELGEDE
jgi:hypothetical protein